MAVFDIYKMYYLPNDSLARGIWVHGLRSKAREANADFDTLDADDTDDADFLKFAIHTGISHRRKKKCTIIIVIRV